ncbi:hypothetical protein TNCV_3662521 [Trichonephila clavipes]|nr:hypothetical protein TNCV_4491521 [Trichonephila clavipes]GFT78583.1 hypothetical protein TNCV_3662521 [Trichonephila clavipes]
MSYEHRAGGYAPYLRMGRKKCTSSRKVVSQKVLTKICTEPPDVTILHHYLNECGLIQSNTHIEGGSCNPTGHGIRVPC